MWQQTAFKMEAWTTGTDTPVTSEQEAATQSDYGISEDSVGQIMKIHFLLLIFAWSLLVKSHITGPGQKPSQQQLMLFLQFNAFEEHHPSDPTCPYNSLKIVDRDGKTLMAKKCGTSLSANKSNTVNLFFGTDGLLPEGDYYKHRHRRNVTSHYSFSLL